HTKTPADIISYSQQFGEFVSFKLDNMQLQHDELYADATPTPKAPHKPIAMIAISNGEGIADLFSSFGCDVVIDGGQTMNTSAQEILDAIGSLSADKIVVYPNHENIFKAAEQAVALSGQSNVVIMPAKSVMQCYYSMAMDIADCEDVEQRLRMLENGCHAIAVTSVTQCVKNCVCNGVVCLKGEYVVISDGDPIACVPTYLDVVQVLLDRHLLENAEMCIVFCGKDAIGFSEEEFQKAVEAQSPMLEVAFVEGNQRIYDLIIGVVI
ncbi:MAG: hypothetical protein J6R42_05895, partial [Clostridia bacterium]|nr:hypothetical protein [Clostridia bacterium]